MSRTTRYASSSSSRNARSSLNPRPIASTMSRTFTARNLSFASDSSIVTSPLSPSPKSLPPLNSPPAPLGPHEHLPPGDLLEPPLRLPLGPNEDTNPFLGYARLEHGHPPRTVS